MYHILVADARERSILVCKENLCLPALKCDGLIGTEIDNLCAFVRAGLNIGFDITFLRHGCEELEGSSYSTTLLVFEALDGNVSPAPANCTWVPHTKADAITVDPRKSSVVQYLKDCKTHWLGIHPENFWPYSRTGWFAETRSWMSERLARNGVDVKST